MIFYIEEISLSTKIQIIKRLNYYNGTKFFKHDFAQKQVDYENKLDILIIEESSMVSNELLTFHGNI